MPLSLKEINRQRELMNYDYSHLYNIVRYGTRHDLLPIATRKREVNVDPAEYGVIAIVNGKKKIWKFSSFERCVQEAERRNGQIVRLGRNNSIKSGDVRSSHTVAQIDESGTIEPLEQEIEGDQDYNVVISLALEEMGYPKAIQYTSTRPTAKDLLTLHKRHPDVSMEDFAAAVLKHCEVPSSKGKFEHNKSGPFKTEQEKEDWYSTPAGQQWVKDNPVPPIMTYTLKESFEWKNPKQSK